MQINLTQAQLKRILELLEKAKENRSDTYLIGYLRHYEKLTYAEMIQLDEIPF
jgi:hypothetical protein